MPMLRACFAVTLILASSPALADDDRLTIRASFRVRGEAVDGQLRGSGDQDAALLLRTRIAAEYAGDGFRLGGELVDSRAYLQPRLSNVSPNEVDTLEPVQAWAAVPIGRETLVKAGRFTMDFGSGRLVVDENFRNVTNGFTGVRVDWRHGGDRATLFWTLPQQHLPADDARVRDDAVAVDRERRAFQFFGGFASIGGVLGGTAELYAYRLAERDAPGFATRNRRLWTPGLRLVSSPTVNKLDHELELVWQTGTARASAAPTDTVDRRVSAGFVHAALGYRFAGALRPRLLVGADYASGDGRGDTLGRFDTLYGARSFELGPSSLYGVVQRANLVSVETRLIVEPQHRPWDGYLAVRPLWLARATDSFGSTGLRDATGGSGHAAGTQVEGRVRYWLRQDRLRLNGGLACVARGRFLDRTAPRAGASRYGYVELVFTP